MSEKLQQIYGRAGKIYYWSPEEGEVCVNLSLHTSSTVLLTRCEDDEAIYMIRRFEPLWSKVAWVFYKPEQLTKKEQRGRLSGPTEHVYQRDGQLYYWDTNLGEYPIEPKWESSLGGYMLVVPMTRSELAARNFRVPDLPLIESDHPLWYRLRNLMKRNQSERQTQRKNPKGKNPKSKKRIDVRTLVAKALR